MIIDNLDECSYAFAILTFFKFAFLIHLFINFKFAEYVLAFEFLLSVIFLRDLQPTKSSLSLSEIFLFVLKTSKTNDF